jgi:ribosomal protein S18 acetylase RimI-like enzyme
MTIKYLNSYTYTVTSEPDEDFRKYLARKLRELPTAASVPAMIETREAAPLDISYDDPEGDVMAGIAAYSRDDCLHIDMLWVDPGLRGRGIGRCLVEMAEDVAMERGCRRVRVGVSAGVEFFHRLGYAVTGKLQQFPQGNTFYWLSKDLLQPVSLIDIYHRKGPA